MKRFIDKAATVAALVGSLSGEVAAQPKGKGKGLDERNPGALVIPRDFNRNNMPEVSQKDFHRLSREEKELTTRGVLTVIEKIFPVAAGSVEVYSQLPSSTQAELSRSIFEYGRLSGNIFRHQLLGLGGLLDQELESEHSAKRNRLKDSQILMPSYDEIVARTKKVAKTPAGATELFRLYTKISQILGGKNVLNIAPAKKKQGERVALPQRPAEATAPVPLVTEAEINTELPAAIESLPESADHYPYELASEQAAKPPLPAEAEAVVAQDPGVDEIAKQPATKKTLPEPLDPFPIEQAAVELTPSAKEKALLEKHRPNPGDRMFNTGLRKEFRGQPIVSLTFDDGPHPTRTAEILDILREHNAKATFYVLGQRVSDPANREILKRIIAEGP
jgi:hypothetical protein